MARVRSPGRSWRFPIRDPALVEGVLKVAAGRAGLTVVAAVQDPDAEEMRDGDAVVRIRRFLRLEGPEGGADLRFADRVEVDARRREVGRTHTLEVDAEPSACDAVLRLLAELARARCIEPAPAEARSAPCPVEAARVSAAAFAAERFAACGREALELVGGKEVRANASADCLRGSLRRLRAAAVLFGRYLPREIPRGVDALDLVLTALDAVRTLGRQRERIDAWVGEVEGSPPVMAEARRLVSGQEHRARRRLEQALASDSTRLWLRAVERFCEQPEVGRDDGTSAAAFAQRALAERFARFHAHGVRLTLESEADEFHRLLALAETVRFAVERFAPLLDRAGPPLERALSAVEERLLRHHDADLAARHLRLVALRTGLPTGRETVFVLGALAQRHRDEGRHALAWFPEAFLRAAGHRWRRVRERLRSLCAGEDGTGPESKGREPTSLE